jgi:hypothetical protein
MKSTYLNLNSNIIKKENWFNIINMIKKIDHADNVLWNYFKAWIKIEKNRDEEKETKEKNNKVCITH